MVAKVSPLAVPKFLTALDRSPDAVRLLVIEHRAEFAHVEPATARFTLKKCSRTQHWQRNATTAESGGLGLVIVILLILLLLGRL